MAPIDPLGVDVEVIVALVLEPFEQVVELELGGDEGLDGGRSGGRRAVIRIGMEGFEGPCS